MELEQRSEIETTLKPLNNDIVIDYDVEFEDYYHDNHLITDLEKFIAIARGNGHFIQFRDMPYLLIELA
jgi:hypothetical protein